MTRFNYDDEDFQDENLFPDTESEADYLRQQDAFNQMQMQIVKWQLNQKLLSRIIKMCETQDGWVSKSHKARLKMIVESYSVLSNLVDGPEGEVE